MLRLFRRRSGRTTSEEQVDPGFSWEGLKPEDEYLAAVSHRINTSIGRMRKNPLFASNPVPYLEKYVVSQQTFLMDTVYSAGMARRLALEPVQRDQHRSLAHVQSLLMGYITIGVHVNNQCVGPWHGTGANRDRLNALTQIHARSLLIAEEIFCLLLGGFPSGAQALCRTLYELSIIAKVLGSSPAVISRRYQQSHIVELWRSLEDEHTHGLHHLEPESVAIWNTAKKKFEAVIRRFGREMTQPYGWATPLFNAREEGRRKRRVTFSDLDVLVGETERRWRYRNASHYVHAAHLGTVKSVALGDAGVLTVGPRSIGFAEPATDCLWDLHEIEEVLLRTANKAAGLPEPLYWLEVQTLSVTSMHLLVNESAGTETLDQLQNQRVF